MRNWAGGKGGLMIPWARVPGPTFLLFLMVTLVTPGTGFMPSFWMALRLFFSGLLCFPRAPPSASSAHTIPRALPPAYAYSNVAHHAARPKADDAMRQGMHTH